jgi:hypothetical protein
VVVLACFDVTGVSDVTCFAATTGAVTGGAYYGIKYGVKNIHDHVKELKEICKTFKVRLDSLRTFRSTVAELEVFWTHARFVYRVAC